MDYLVSALAGVVGQLPLFVVLIGGFVFAMTRRQRHPRAATYVVIGMVAAFLSLLISTIIVVLAPFVPSIVHDLDVPISVYSTVIGVINVIASLLAAAGWVMAIVALFVARKPAQPSYGGTPQ